MQMPNIKVDMKKVVMGAGVAGSLLLAAGVFVMSQPMMKTIDKAREEEKTYAQKFLLVKDVLATRDVKGIYAHLIPKNKVSTVIEKVNTLAANDSLAFKLLRPPFTAARTADSFDRVLFDVQASGPLKGMSSFLSAVRNMPEGLVDIDSLRLWPDEADPKTLTAKISFALLVVKNNE